VAAGAASPAGGSTAKEAETPLLHAIRNRIMVRPTNTWRRNMTNILVNSLQELPDRSLCLVAAGASSQIILQMRVFPLPLTENSQSFAAQFVKGQPYKTECSSTFP
jgi:hypothetical protein